MFLYYQSNFSVKCLELEDVREEKPGAVSDQTRPTYRTGIPGIVPLRCDPERCKSQNSVISQNSSVYVLFCIKNWKILQEKTVFTIFVNVATISHRSHIASIYTANMVTHKGWDYNDLNIFNSVHRTFLIWSAVLNKHFQMTK